MLKLEISYSCDCDINQEWTTHVPLNEEIPLLQETIETNQNCNYCGNLQPKITGIRLSDDLDYLQII